MRFSDWKVKIGTFHFNMIDFPQENQLKPEIYTGNLKKKIRIKNDCLP